MAGTDPAARAALGCLQIIWKAPTESEPLCQVSPAPGRHLSGLSHGNSWEKNQPSLAPQQPPEVLWEEQGSTGKRL